MTRRHAVGSTLLLVCCVIFILFGFSLEKSSEGGAIDFKIVYAGTQCLLQHQDPYNPQNLQAKFDEYGWKLRPDPLFIRAVVGFVYSPTVLPFLAPFALLPWGLGNLLWMLSTAACMTVAAFLAWDLGRAYSSGFSLLLICFLIANCEVVLASGNTAGIVIAFCMISVWCFLKERFVLIGIFCMAASLAIKPHDAGLIWLFLLLAGGSYRRRALQSLLLMAVISLPAIYRVAQISPHWLSEMQANQQADSVPGGSADPYFTASTSQTANEVIDLQATLSIFRNDPHFYNPAAYLICGAMLLVGLAVTLKNRATNPAEILIALAAIVPITLLVTYHRAYDAKLLLVCIPACALLWARGDVIGRIAGAISTAAVLMTAEIPISVMLMIARKANLSAASMGGKLAIILLRPTPILLLLMGTFYLWVFVRDKATVASSSRKSLTQ